MEVAASKAYNSTYKVAIIVPALNEEGGIGKVIAGLKQAFQGFDYQIVVVDGNSTDNTVTISTANGAKIIYQNQRGYGNALLAGYYYATREMGCQVLITTDADGTYDASDAVRVVEPILNGTADYVVGKRRVSSESMSASHRFGNKVISGLINALLDVKIKDTQCGLFAFRSDLIKKVNFSEMSWAVNTEFLRLARMIGMRQQDVSISYTKRIGDSKVGTWKAGYKNLQVILKLLIKTRVKFFFALLAVPYAIPVPFVAYGLAAGAVGAPIIAALLAGSAGMLIMGRVLEAVKIYSIENCMDPASYYTIK
jgi:glycosyltransferase involved in cell wall biosynthesis